MTVKEGNIICECEASFDWKTFFTDKNEIVIYRADKAQRNVIDQYLSNGQYHITAKCPQCGKKHYTISE